MKINLKKLFHQRLKPIVFQVSRDTSFAIGGLVRIDVQVKEESSVVFYVNRALEIIEVTS